MEGTRHGKMIASQMLDVAVRVQAIRHFAVAQMVSKHALLLYVEGGYFTATVTAVLLLPLHD